MESRGSSAAQFVALRTQHGISYSTHVSSIRVFNSSAYSSWFGPSLAIGTVQDTPTNRNIHIHTIRRLEADSFLHGAHVHIHGAPVV